MKPTQSDVRNRAVETGWAGEAMDRRRPPNRRKRVAVGVGALAVLLAATAAVFARPGEGRLAETREEAVTLGEVKRGEFADFVAVRGRVTPAKTIFLDAVEGGRVEARHVQEGEAVGAGQLLVVLSNTQLQLDVIAREAAVEEQLNDLRTLELALERNRLDHARNLVDIEQQIIALEKVARRRQVLAGRGVVPAVQLEEAQDDLAHQQARLRVLNEARLTDERLAKAQVEQLRDSTTRLNRNLELARRNLDALNIRAPTAGRLTALAAEEGQSLSRGQRIGQIDSPEDFKLRARIDEFFIDRLEPGLPAEVRLGEEMHRLRLDKVYPQVTEGQFDADLVFVGPPPANLRRGQSLQARIVLGDPAPATLVPVGAWLNDTGGNWALVLEEGGREAVRRPIRTGRRNTEFIEALEGLRPGERVILSAYARYGDADRVVLKR